MQTVEAYKCERTKQLFEHPRDAARCEFKAMMKSAGGKLGAMGSVNPVDILEWLANNMTSNVHPTFQDALFEALDYFKANRETITQR